MRRIYEFMMWLSSVERHTKHTIGHIGTGFYGSNDPTNSVKALKEVVVLKIGFNPTRSTSPCYNTTHACNIQSYRKYIHAYTKMNLSTVKLAQWDKTQSTDLLGLFMCVHCTVHNCCIQYCTEQTWSFSLLPSRQSPLLRLCLFEGRGGVHDVNEVWAMSS